jgi:hypothetical protein
VFFCMVLGVFDFGQFLFLHQALVERARWAVRYAVTKSVASSDSGSSGYGDATCAAEGIATCAQNQMLYYSSSTGSNPYYGLTAAMVQVSTVSQTTSSTNALPADSPNTYSSVQILITGYQYKMYSPFSIGTYSGPNIYQTFPLGQF